MPAVTAVPAHTDPHAFFPVGHIRPDRIDDAHHLMAGYARILDAGKSTGDREHVAVAYAAGLNLDAHLARLRVRDVALDDLESGIGLGDLNGFHSRHKGFPLEGVRLMLTRRGGRRCRSSPHERRIRPARAC